MSTLEQDMEERAEEERLAQTIALEKERQEQKELKASNEKWFRKTAETAFAKLIAKTQVTVEPDTQTLSFSFNGKTYYIRYEKDRDERDHMYSTRWVMRKDHQWVGTVHYLTSNPTPDPKTDWYEEVLKGLKALAASDSRR